jgi:hypothetical protein
MRNSNLSVMTAEERLKGLWLKASAAVNPAEQDRILFQFRDALHEYLEQLRTKSFPGESEQNRPASLSQGR